jgi:hypothetical protein
MSTLTTILREWPPERTHFGFRPTRKNDIEDNTSVKLTSHNDDDRQVLQHIEALLLEGMRSEESELTRWDFDDIRKEALAQIIRRE